MGSSILNLFDGIDDLSLTCALKQSSRLMSELYVVIATQTLTQCFSDICYQQSSSMTQKLGKSFSNISHPGISFQNHSNEFMKKHRKDGYFGKYTMSYIMQKSCTSYRVCPLNGTSVSWFRLNIRSCIPLLPWYKRTFAHSQFVCIDD